MPQQAPSTIVIDEEDEDEEVEEVGLVPISSSTSGGASSSSGGASSTADAVVCSVVTGGDEAEDCVMTDATGPVATLDFPHGYHDCLHRHGMAPKGPDERKCDNCFCVVCNMPHTSCKRWSDHWRIRQGSQEARDARQAAADAERPFVDKSTVRLTDLKQLVTPLSATRVGKFDLTLAQRTAAAWMDGIRNGRAGAVPSTLITRTKERASEVPSQPVRGGIRARLRHR